MIDEIEVGKTYVLRSKIVATIVEITPGNVYPFISNLGNFYTANGKYYCTGEEHELDIIEEFNKADPIKKKAPIECVIELLKQHAKTECYYDMIEDDSNNIESVYDVSSSNVDDAFEIGELTGYTILARELLTIMDIKFNVET